MKTLVSTLCLVFVMGCGNQGKKKGPETVAVSGTITYKGRPLVNAHVNFVSGEFAAYGKTDSEGKYTLVQGAVPGKNKVFVKTYSGAVEDPDEGMDPAQIDAAATGNPNVRRRKKTGETLPPEISDPEKTKLTFTVPEGGTDSANFTLN